MNTIMLIVVHRTHQQATDGDFLRLSPNQAMVITAAIGIPFIVVGVVAKLQRWTTR